MLETYALILLLGLTDEEQLLAKDYESFDPVQNATELILTETEVEDRIEFVDYQDQVG